MKKQPWTVRELELIEKHYGSMSAVEIQKNYLPDRTLNAIRFTGQKLGLGRWNRVNWSDDEIALLRDHYHQKGSEIPGLMKNRSQGSIRQMAQELGLTLDTLWSDSEIKLLCTNYPVGGVAAAMKALPNKGRNEIQGKAHRLNLKYKRKKGDGTSALAWSDEELRILKENDSLPASKLSQFFPDRTVVAISAMRSRLRRGRR